jgi:hypothetical protein
MIPMPVSPRSRFDSATASSLRWSGQSGSDPDGTAAGLRWTGCADRETAARAPPGVDSTITLRVQWCGTDQGVLRALVDSCAAMTEPQEVTEGWNFGGLPYQAPGG